MVDEPSSLGEAVMLEAGSIEHRELIYYTVSKIDNFSATPVTGTEAGPAPGRAYRACGLRDRERCRILPMWTVGRRTGMRHEHAERAPNLRRREGG
jgi:hypothetical protein